MPSNPSAHSETGAGVAAATATSITAAKRPQRPWEDPSLVAANKLTASARTRTQNSPLSLVRGNENRNNICSDSQRS